MAMACALAGTALAVDPLAEAAFDAPKRLLAVAGVVVAVPAVLWSSAWRPRMPGRGRARTVLVLALPALVGSVVAMLGAPHRAAALDTTRLALLLAMMLPLGASRALAQGGGRVLLAVFLGAAAVNAGLAVLQAAGLLSVFAVEAIAGRIDAGGMIGNEGHLAQILALATVAATAVGLTVRRPRIRRAALAGLVLYAAGLAATRNLTAVAAGAAGAAVAIVLVLGRRGLVPLAVLTVVLGTSVTTIPPLRARVLEASRDARSGAWDAVLTYRLGPWAAATEMVRERPLRGFGLGTFGAEFVPHRLAAEIRFGRRFTIPLLTSTFAQAHSDYLQLAAEAGVPAAACAVAALGLLLAGLVRLARRAPETELVVLVAVLATAALMALTWFPLERPVSALPLTLVAGRAWRRLAHAAPPAPRAARPMPRAAQLLLAGVLLAAAAPELTRYGAERRLRVLTATAQAVFTQQARVHEPRRVLASLDAAALAVAPALPGESRAWILAGSTRLVAGDAAGALERYGRALTLGERPEIVLNQGRALALREDRHDAARAAFARAVWVSPPLLDVVPPAMRDEVQAVVAAATGALAAGRLDAPPPLPPAVP